MVVRVRFEPAVNDLEIALRIGAENLVRRLDLFDRWVLS